MTLNHSGVELPVFMAAVDQPRVPLPERPSREFERLVNADLRDKFAAGPAYAVLSRKENLVRWMQVLTGIVDSISDQNAHDKSLLAMHPDKPLGGGPTPQSYADAKREVEERKRRRARAIQAVNERIGEVRRLIGVEPLSERAVGEVVEGLLAVRRCVMDGMPENAMRKIAGMIAALTGAEVDGGE